MANIVFEEIKIRNFLSFGDEEQSYKFRSNGMVLVLGKNKDVKTLHDSSNGGGKSSFCVNALLFCLYGETDKKIKKDSVVNNVVGKNCSVKIKCMVNKDEYSIERYRLDEKNKDNLILKVKREGSSKWEDLTRTAAGITQDFVNSIFGDFKTFINSIVFSQEMLVNFLKLRSFERKEIVEKILQLEKLNEVQEKIKEKHKAAKETLSSIKKEISDWTIEINTKKSSIKNYKEQTASESKNIIEEVAHIDSEIAEISKIDVDVLKKIKERHTNSQIKLQEFKASYDAKEQMLKEYVDIIKKNKRERISAQEKSNNIKTIKKNPKKCPVCENHIEKEKFASYVGKLDEELNGKITEIKERIKQREELKKRIKDLIGYSKAKLDALNKEYKEAYLESSKYNYYWNKLDKLSLEVEQLKKKRSEKEGLLNGLFNKSYVEKIESEIQTIENKIPAKEKEKKEKEIDVLHYEWLTESLDLKNEKGLKNYIILSNLPIINQRLEFYSVAIFPSPVTIKFNSKFDEEITVDGKEIAYENLSGGEKARLNIIINLTIFDLVRLNFNKFNILVFDEVLDHNLDKDAVIKFLNIFKTISLSNSILLISHQDWLKSTKTTKECLENNREFFKEIVIIEKENKFSRINVFN